MNAVAAPASNHGAATATATAMDFAYSARHLSARARTLGLHAHLSFRSPPKVLGTDRSLRLLPGGGAVIAVRLKVRPLIAVQADMVDGVIAANKIRDPQQAAQLRTQLAEGLFS